MVQGYITWSFVVAILALLRHGLVSCQSCYTAGVGSAHRVGALLAGHLFVQAARHKLASSSSAARPLLQTPPRPPYLHEFL